LSSVDELPGLDNEELQQVFRKVEEKLESDAEQFSRDENQITIDDALKLSEASESEASPAEAQEPTESEIAELPFDLPEQNETLADD
ncbi:MAG: hypothetical protein IKT72_04955, partial [Clostridia bacterium]|nr:hypothetical protein [Clostridia bacterium]